MRIAGPLLYVTPTDHAVAPGGRAKLSRLHQMQLRDLLGDDFHRFVLPARRSRPAKALLHGHINGIDRDSIAALTDAIERERINRVFLDGSNLGAAAQAIKRRHPGVRIITFCHNVEARFFLGALRARPTPRALAILAANARAEHAAMRSSDTVVCLSERDSRLLQRLYRRGADAIVPMVMEDIPRADTPPRPVAEPYLLFVGGSFYANRDAVRWYADTISPALPIATMVVGHGMDQVAPAPNLTMVGAVDDIAPWYAHALAVVAPVRDGSGMKTKVAEALMFGKQVIGTAEAFSGYDRTVVAANRQCDEPASFRRAIDAICADPPPAFDRAIRLLYERFHAPAVARRGLAAILSA
ncbi:glycosyltransferase [Sphingomonas qomolangmaensis]|uniref:Glycosyltransferase family 4 protein n=1 Tax=Sphingomonas qomolangmaensis TaxID=2918765 RepID=A0ABY5L675_9SPHN|nr:glycosyltransferase [Sphingomonas qomolangmaensis]UUL82468.1 glycosyltransferase family 4 protein [Sphingomonas qomolangmaensis]